MLTNFNRDLELTDGLETDFMRLLYYDLSPQFNSVYKSYEYSRLCTIIEGRKHVSVNDGAQFTYNPGKFIVLPPHSNIRMDIDVPTKALVFELNSELLKKVSEKICIEYNVDFDSVVADKFFLGNFSQNMTSCIDKIACTSTEANRNKEFLLDLYAQELVYNLVQIKGIQQILNIDSDNPVQKAIRFMQQNYNHAISMKQLSADLNMSEANFCQYFKKITGVTPKDYLTNLKLSKARDMIRNGSVTDAAMDLGYENISHFITLFKEKYGITPKQYQKEIKN